MPTVHNPSIGAGAAPVLVKTTAITAAQIAALHTTPITLIQAPGAGFLTLVMAVCAVMNPGSNLFATQGTDSLLYRYTNLSGDTVASAMPGLVPNATPIFTLGLSAGVTEDSLLPGDDNQPVVVGAQANYNAGPIVTTTLGAGGAGYAVNDTGTITQGANDATYQVLTVGAGGAVLTYQITGAGTKYVTANGVATATGGAQPGVGVGFTVNITAVQPGNGTLKVTTYYQVLAVP